MATFLTILHVFTCVVLILLVLIQSGKGAEISASLGGSSQTVFGSSGGANFFTRFTTGAAAVFFVTSLVLTVMGSQQKKGLFSGQSTQSAPAQSAPVAPVQTAPAQSAPVAPAAPAKK